MYLVQDAKHPGKSNHQSHHSAKKLTPILNNMVASEINFNFDETKRDELKTNRITFTFFQKVDTDTNTSKSIHFPNTTYYTLAI